jgi:hypothetical protein
MPDGRRERAEGGGRGQRGRRRREEGSGDGGNGNGGPQTEAVQSWFKVAQAQALSTWEKIVVATLAVLLGIGSLVVGAFLSLDPPDDGVDEGSWAYLIVALFVALLLFYRSAFTFGPAEEPELEDEEEEER